MTKWRFLKTHRFRRLAALVGAGFTWLALVSLLPPKPSNAVAAVGLIAAIVAYLRWADDPKERPRWGCFIHIPQQTIEIKLSAEAEAKRTMHRERQTLLRAAAKENSPEQELLRPAIGFETWTPQEMLQHGNKPE